MRILAYLDPGAGSVVAQAVVAGLAGLAVVVKLAWRRLTSRMHPGRVPESRSSMPSDLDGRGQR